MKNLLLLLSICSSLWGSSTLFVVHDFGEISGLMSMMEETKGKVAILNLRGSTLDGHLNDLMIDYKIEGMKRDTPLVDLSFLSFEPTKIISGVSYFYMGQILDQFPHAEKICFWDNFSPDGDSDYFATGHEVIRHADRVMVPNRVFLNHEKFADLQLDMVVHPSLKEWVNRDGTGVKEELNLLDNHTSVLFLGGYGEAYENAFDQFLDVVEEFEGYDVRLTPHPKFGKKYPFNTADLVDPFDILVTHKSTAGLLAALTGKRVIFFTPEDPNYTNIAIESGDATVAYSQSELVELLEEKR